MGATSAIGNSNPEAQLSQENSPGPIEEISLFNSLYTQLKFDDPISRLIGWNMLKTKADIGPLNIPMLMRQVEQEVPNDQPLLFRVEALFQRFAEKLSPYFDVANFPDTDRQVTELQLLKLQAKLQVQYENDALELIWNRKLRHMLRLHGAFTQTAAPVGVEEIRQWLDVPENTRKLQWFKELRLDDLDLKVLPSEIGLFTELESLRLNGTQLRSLPESFGNLTKLKTLSLRGSQLRSLPESFGNLTNLTRLFLFDTQLSSLPESFGNLCNLRELSLVRSYLSSLPESFGNLSNLTKLELSNNKLSSLPESVRNLTNLTSLELSRNELRSLPEGLGNLTELTGLYLNNNELRSLPEGLGNLTKLTGLYLRNNQLSVLPKAFGNLTNLTSLVLSENQLSFLPKSFDKLTKLTDLFLDRNRWLLVSDKEVLSIQSYGIYAARLELLKKYVPQSPLASLFKSIGFNEPVERVQQAYEGLSERMQQSIAALAAQNQTDEYSIMISSSSNAASSSLSSSNTSSIDLFADMGLFARSVRKAAYDLYNSLEKKQKDLAHWRIWDLAGRTEPGDSNWGENHAFDHMLRFADALDLATRSL